MKKKEAKKKAEKEENKKDKKKTEKPEEKKVLKEENISKQREESTLEETLEEEEEIQQFIQQPSSQKFSPVLEQVESAQQKVPLEQQDENFTLEKNKKKEKIDYSEREPVSYDDKREDREYSTNSLGIKQSRIDYDSLGNQSQRNSLELHREFETEEEHDYTIKEQRLENPSANPFQRKKSDYRIK